MKNWLKFILLALVASCSMQAHAEEPHDTIYFYDNWAQIMYMEPSGGFMDPFIALYTPYEIGIETGVERIDQAIRRTHIAATIGDSIWLINSEYLKREFVGDTKKLREFMPFFFSDKVAYITYVGEGDNLDLKHILFGDTEIDYEEIVDYYFIDFQHKKVVKITPSSLSELLEDYHDLQMRYEGMKDYKKREIMLDYFFKYIERANQDVMKPYILDLFPPKAAATD
jgi:hypothetical protein